MTSIGDLAFCDCTSLTNVTIPNSVTAIEGDAFFGCESLISVTIPSSITSIGDYAFAGCYGLAGVYFEGNAPSLVGPSVFHGSSKVIIYHLPGTTGWGATLAGRPTVLWFLPNPVILNSGPSFGVHSNEFGFIFSWATNTSVVMEACTDLVNPIWFPASTNNLTNGWSHFSDPAWTNYPARFYRLRSP